MWLTSFGYDFGDNATWRCQTIFYTQLKGVGKATDTFRNKRYIVEVINLILSIRATSYVINIFIFIIYIKT